MGRQLAWGNPHQLISELCSLRDHFQITNDHDLPPDPKWFIYVVHGLQNLWLDLGTSTTKLYTVRRQRRNVCFMVYGRGLFTSCGRVVFTCVYRVLLHRASICDKLWFRVRHVPLHISCLHVFTCWAPAQSPFAVPNSF